MRFENIDGPRNVPGAQEQQLADLAELGMVPDVVDVQSESWSEHHALWERARAEGRVYGCTCSRKEVNDELARMASAPHGAVPLYTGHCRDLDVQPGGPNTAWRFRTEDGRQDFVIGRTVGQDFQPAYHWACALDDWRGQYLAIVRAIDLKDALVHQRGIQAWLGGAGFVPIGAVHARLVVQDDGHRLEKRTRGVTLSEWKNQGKSPRELISLFEKTGGLELSNARAVLASGGIIDERPLEPLPLKELLSHGIP